MPEAWTEHGFQYWVNKSITRGHRFGVDPSTGRATGQHETFDFPNPRARGWIFRWAPSTTDPEVPGAPKYRMASVASSDRGDGKINVETREGIVSIDIEPDVHTSNLWWSPDGREVLFANRLRTQPNLRTVQAVDVERGTVRELFPRLEGIGKTHVSPDGRQMVTYQPEGGRARGKMVVSEVGEKEGLVVARAGAQGDFSPQDGQPLFSPDGSEIVFVRWFDPEDGAAVWVVGSDGSGERELARAWGIDQPPQWDPTGRMIAFVARGEDRRLRLMVVPTDGGEAWEVIDLTALEVGGRLQDWSPDGAWIGFQDSMGRSELWFDRDPLRTGS